MTSTWRCWGEKEFSMGNPIRHRNRFRSSPDEYQSYNVKLQKEYATESYQKERLKMLKTLLMIPFIYSNEKLRDRFEAAARKNIQHEIEELQQ